MKRLLRLLLLLLLSVVGTIVLLIGAGMAGGACHCMTPMFTLFPYGSFITERTSWENFGFFLLLAQFPLYVIIVTIIKGVRWKVASLVLIAALHLTASYFGLRAYCQSRHTCAISMPSNKSLDASGGSVFLNLLGAAEDVLIRAAASTQTLCAFGIPSNTFEVTRMRNYL